MQYFVNRRENGQLTGSVVVVSETSGQRSTLMHRLGRVQVELHYLLTPESESGPTRLDLTCRWPAPKQTGAAEAVSSKIAESMQALVTDYKSLIEAERGRANPAGQADGAG
jgi:hypothetical protein